MSGKTSMSFYQKIKKYYEKKFDYVVQYNVLEILKAFDYLNFILFFMFYNYHK